CRWQWAGCAPCRRTRPPPDGALAECRQRLLSVADAAPALTHPARLQLGGCGLPTPTRAPAVYAARRRARRARARDGCGGRSMIGRAAHKFARSLAPRKTTTRLYHRAEVTPIRHLESEARS